MSIFTLTQICHEASSDGRRGVERKCVELTIFAVFLSYPCDGLNAALWNGVETKHLANMLTHSTSNTVSTDWFICVFIFGLFNNAVGKWKYVALNLRMIREYWVEEDVGGSGGGLIRSTIPPSAFMDWGNNHKPESGQLVSRYFANAKCKGHRLSQMLCALCSNVTWFFLLSKLELRERAYLLRGMKVLPCLHNLFRFAA